jgi:hypothetical protein
LLGVLEGSWLVGNGGRSPTVVWLLQRERIVATSVLGVHRTRIHLINGAMLLRKALMVVIEMQRIVQYIRIPSIFPISRRY